MQLPRHYRGGTVAGASGRADVVSGADPVGVVCGRDSSLLGAVDVDSSELVGVVVSPGEVVSDGLVVVVVVLPGVPVFTSVRGTQV